MSPTLARDDKYAQMGCRVLMRDGIALVENLKIPPPPKEVTAVERKVNSLLSCGTFGGQLGSDSSHRKDANSRKSKAKRSSVGLATRYGSPRANSSFE